MVNYKNILMTAGIISAMSTTAFAMDEKDERPLNHTVKSKIKDMYVFDHWALHQITGLREEHFPQELVNLISSKIVVFTEEFLKYSSRIDPEHLYRCLDYTPNYPLVIKGQYIYCYSAKNILYKELFFTINEDCQKKFKFFHHERMFNHLKTPLVEMVDFKNPECFYDYKIMFPEKTENISFSITFLSKEYVNQNINYAKSCSKHLQMKCTGHHIVDYYRNHLETLKSGVGRECSWHRLDLVDYETYERRMEYDIASEERKKEMLEETKKYREKNAKRNKLEYSLIKTKVDIIDKFIEQNCNDLEAKYLPLNLNLGKYKYLSEPKEL